MAGRLSFERRRWALVEELKREGITDRRVLEAIANVPREAFVPPELIERAYENNALAIGCEQTISQPFIVALMTQSLELAGTERVLEIGTGSGYQAAVLAQLAGEVYTIERIDELAERARRTLTRLGRVNVHFKVADGTRGWPDEAPFERIIVTARSPHVPPALLEQLAEGGILVIPIGGEDRQALFAFHKRADLLRPVPLCECRFVPLIDDEG